MYYYESSTCDPYENLATEEYLFRTLPAGSRLLMLWQNRDAVIIGRYQNTAQEINAPYVREHGIAVVRRLSGGGAVFHDTGGLNYTIISDEENGQEETGGEEAGSTGREPSEGAAAELDPVWQRCMAPLLDVLAEYGLTACFSGRNDILIGDSKIAGCAQYAAGGRMLHHGCILFDTNPAKVAAALCPSKAKYVSRGDKSVTSRVTTIRACLDKRTSRTDGPATARDLERDLREAYRRQAAEMIPYVLTEADRREIRRLADEKYRTWEWNYGYRADYQVRGERRFAGGMVQAGMDVRGGHIGEISLTGDFFAAGDVAALERALSGLALDERLAENLRARLAEQEEKPAARKEYIKGVTLDELADLLGDLGGRVRGEAEDRASHGGAK